MSPTLLCVSHTISRTPVLIILLEIFCKRAFPVQRPSASSVH
ncbi:hypothetical protein KP509_31G039000 [Ceratopteris richardii]|uniref:Uncharacterized protein n=1 Tax=Ceratopteris richardii TaxID=49495 RepID=A0A8T2QZH3_CERRI|nr:hypothetical protein KP509_31G039000 [Ceratopteris richardii]